ncbi:MAG: hypothetical protein WBC69_16740 [Geitlerinemataceae cyanobacterium]
MFEDRTSTQELYNDTASRWVRGVPCSLSDFTARPAVLEQLVHRTLQDYFEALQNAGFSTMPTLRELRVLPEHVQLDESFFKPLVDFPLHLAFEVSR